MSVFPLSLICDVCWKNDFRMKRYKCLECIDYDICSLCYDKGKVSASHKQNHAVQCIISKEALKLHCLIIQNSFTCPLCGKCGFSIVNLKKHVDANHMGTTQTIHCPICIVRQEDEELPEMTNSLSWHLHWCHPMPSSVRVVKKSQKKKEETVKTCEHVSEYRDNSVLPLLLQSIATNTNKGLSEAEKNAKVEFMKEIFTQTLRGSEGSQKDNTSK